MRRTAAGLGVGLAALFALAGCNLPGFTSAKAPSTTSTVAPGSGANTTVLGGSAVPSPSATSVPLPSPSFVLPTLPKLPTVSPTTSANVIAGACGYRQPGTVNGLSSVPGPGTVTVTWWHSGDPTVQSYRLAAVTQQLQYGQQPAPTWVTVAPAKVCQSMTTTLTGLTRNSPYVVWLDAIIKNPMGGATQDLMIGRSIVVSTT